MNIIRVIIITAQPSLIYEVSRMLLMTVSTANQLDLLTLCRGCIPLKPTCRDFPSAKGVRPFKHFQGEWQVISLRSLYKGSLMCGTPVTAYLLTTQESPRVVTNKKPNKPLHPSRQEQTHTSRKPLIRHDGEANHPTSSSN